jgi:trans-L-3-hydroxyproline dehydratase
MYGCVPTPAVTDDGELGCLFLHNEGYSTMCGHGIIALTTVALECGLLAGPPEADRLAIDTPAGRVVAHARREGRRVRSVSFRNVPSFVVALDLVVDVPGFGPLACDVAFGGAFYAYVAAADLGLALEPGATARLIEAGRRVKAAVSSALELRHPDGDPDLDFLYGAIFHGPAHAPGARERNVCVFADGEVDRSPTGTGVSGRAAILRARGALEPGEEIAIESVIGTRFSVAAVAETRAGALSAIVPEVTGSAYLTGRHEFWIDPAEPLRDGVLVR